MNKTVSIARTAYDLDHVNRLGVPTFGILDLRLAASGKTSKFYQPAGAPAPTAPENGTDEFHFVPEHETIEIRYEIDDKFLSIDGAKLELYNRFEEDPLWSLDLKVLGPDWWAHGKHVVKWDGRIVKPTAKVAGTAKDYGFDHDLTAIALDKSLDPFKDGYVTLEHTPYKLRLTVTSTDAPSLGNPDYAWTYYHILVKSIELELGCEEAVPATTVDDEEHKRNKALRAKIEADGGLPTGTGIRKIHLISNLYKTASAQMNDDTGYTAFKTLWGNGPNIPVFAKIRLSASDDAEVKIDETPKGAVALGKVTFLWDWEDPDEDVDSQQSQAKPKAFIKDAINYDKATTKPKGDNCHKDRGGKRGDDSVAVFPEQAGYDPKDTLDAGKFPFWVSTGIGSGDPKPDTRKWSSYSRGWTSGKLKGKTGVVFQPARMAGDNYKLTVYLAYDRTAKDKIAFNVDTEPLKAADAIKKSTGIFQLWREIHLARYIRKSSGIAAFLPGNLGAIQALYNEAYVHLEDKMGADNQYDLASHRLSGGGATDYNTKCYSLLNGSGNTLYTDFLAVENNADHASVDSAFKVRTYAEFITQVHERLNPGTAADFTLIPGITATTLPTAALPTTGLTPPQTAARTRLASTKSQLTTLGVATVSRYCAKLDDQLCTFIETQMGSMLQLISGGKDGVNQAAAEGITVIHFNTTNTFLRDQLAAGTPGIGSIFGSAIDPTDASREKCAFLYLSPRVDTFVHEIGHHAFLPHAPTAGGFVAARHDDSDTGCIMSYNRPRPAFCGLCQLRLRGWTSGALSKTSASNKKP